MLILQQQMRFKRILLKLSGEALLGSQSYGIDAKVLEAYAKEVKKVVDDVVQYESSSLS